MRTHLTTGWAHLQVDMNGVPAKLQGTHPVSLTAVSGGFAG